MSTTYATIHLLGGAKIIAELDHVYPGFTIKNGSETQMIVSLTEQDDIPAFLADLRKVADALEAWKPPVEEPESASDQPDEEAKRDDLVDAGLGTGYIGEFR